MSEIVDAARAVAAWPRVVAACDEAREACTGLRFHEALRRRIPEAAAESRVRGARASAELDGARAGADHVRDLMRGATTWPDDPDPVVATLRGAVQATAESEHLTRDLSASPRRALARLHLAAAAPLLPEGRVGRPRRDGEECAEFTDLGAAPDDVTDRLDGIVELLGATDVPALVVGALVHAELCVARPFARGNGLVARAVDRALLVGRGLDTTGVAVVEAGHLAAGHTAYIGSLAAYARGSADGVTLWVEHLGTAVSSGVAEGVRICDAVRAGRLA